MKTVLIILCLAAMAFSLIDSLRLFMAGDRLHSDVRVNTAGLFAILAALVMIHA